jgi:3-methyladenine DNA glycosylase AlkC
MKDLLSDFIAAADSESLDSFEAALLTFKKLKEVKANSDVEIGFVVKTIKLIGLALGERLAAKPKIRLTWLRKLAVDDKAATRCLACIVLGEIGKVAPDSIVATAHKLATDSRWEVRECIANAFDDQIGLAQPEFVYDLMRQWVADPSPNARRVPTNALMRYGIKQPRKVIALMDKLRRDESEYVRKNVKFCLQQIAKEKHPILGPGNADNPELMLATLAEWAKDTNKHNRWIVAGVLGNVWAKERVSQAIGILATLAADNDRLVRGAVAAAMRGLAKFDTETVTAAARQWANDANPNVQQTGTLALKKLK